MARAPSRRYVGLIACVLSLCFLVTAPLFAQFSRTTLSKIINESTIGDRAIISGVAGTRIAVWGIEYFANSAVNITLKCGTTTVLPVQNFAANSGVIRDLRDPSRVSPWFQCAAGESFIFNLAAASQVSGRVYYTQE